MDKELEIKKLENEDSLYLIVLCQELGITITVNPSRDEMIYKLTEYINSQP